jgi:hypothetical protein
MQRHRRAFDLDQRFLEFSVQPFAPAADHVAPHSDRLAKDAAEANTIVDSTNCGTVAVNNNNRRNIHGNAA